MTVKHFVYFAALPPRHVFNDPLEERTSDTNSFDGQCESTVVVENYLHRAAMQLPRVAV